jgi:Phage portal protein, SPP1 Gp6-like
MLADKFNLLGVSEQVARNTASAIIREVQGERALRGENYITNWDMYQNRHEKYFKQRLDEPMDIFKYRKDNAIKSNLCGFTVDLSAKYLYGKASKIVRNFSTNKATDTRMRDVLENFHIESFLLDAAKKAAVYGETTVRLIPVDSITGEQVVGVSTDTSYPHPILTEPARTFVKQNRWKRIAAVVSLYFSVDYKTNKKYTVVELVVSDSRWSWRTTDTIDLFAVGSINSIGVDPLLSNAEVVMNGETNSYALEDEFIHFPNNDDLRSDLVDIIDLNIALDEALTDKQHFFQKHGWPQLVSEVSLENVTYSPNKIWEVIPDVDDKKKVLDRMGFLTWDGKMEDHAKFIKNLERNIMILSNTAAISTGDLEAIGQLRSGAALITAHSVAIHKTEAKQIVWERNEELLFEAIARMDAYLHNEKVEGRYPELEPSIKFPKTFVPGAEMEEVQIHQMELNSHTKALSDIIQEKYGNLSPDEVAAKKAEILEDAREIVDSVREFISVTDGTSEDSGSSNTGNAKGKSGTSSQKSAEQKPKAS